MADQEIRPRILPGDKFVVAYGGGKHIEVSALAGRSQRELGKLLDELKNIEQRQQIERACEIAEECLAVCLGKEKADQLWSTELDIELAIEISGATFAKQAMTADELKKAG